ncbi:MAG: polysaccharide biosynthesis protein [Rhodobacterales bacterium]
MKLILHIGMGKTGTSSIQTALRTNAAALAEQKVHYLGMWFDAIDPAYINHLGLRAFVALDETELQKAAVVFAAHVNQLAETTGAETLILSNEGIFGQVHKMKPFLEELRKHVDLSLVAYIRNPYKWLPSAFTQWGLFHKEHKGPLQSFRVRAATLIGQYAAAPVWIETYGDALTVRLHDTSIDVVEDFCATCGITLDPPKKRALERSEPAELLLRAAFNNRYQGEVFPERFRRMVLSPRHAVPSLHDMTDLCFQHDGLVEIVQDRRELFETLHERLGADFDFLTPPEVSKALPDAAELQTRVIDHLVEIAFQQGERIGKLEQQIQELSKDQ